MDHRVVSLPGEPVRVETVKIAAHKHGNKEIPSGFFDLPSAENVSAVIFSTEGTIPRFNRMGFDFGKHTGVRMIRVGFCMNLDPRPSDGSRGEGAHAPLFPVLRQKRSGVGTVTMDRLGRPAMSQELIAGATRVVSVPVRARA